MRTGISGMLLVASCGVACGSSSSSPGPDTSIGTSGSGAAGGDGAGANPSGGRATTGGRAAAGGLAGADTSTAGATSEGGSEVAGASTNAGSAGTMGGSSSTGKGGATSVAGTTSKGGATSVGGAVSTGGATATAGASGTGDFCPSAWCWSQPRPQGTGALAIWVVADDDVWIGGEAGTFARWDGSKWRYYVVDAQSTQGVISIWGSAANDLWATNGSELFRFNGSAWRKVASPTTVSAGATYVYQISGSGAGDVWFATYDGLFHWTGSAFEAPVMPAVRMNWIQVASSKEAWAISNDNQLLQWNGSGWMSMSFSQPSPMFEGLWAAGPKNMWLVDGGAAWHWDGASFTMSPTLGTGTGFLYYQNFFGGPNDVWLTTPAGVQHVVGDKAVIVPFDATGAAVPLAGMASPGGALWVSGYYGRVWRLETDHFALAVPPLVARTVGDLRGVWSDGKQATIAVGNDWIQDTGSGWEHSTLATGVVEADAVWGSSASDVWAVGSYATINHFDGTGWAPVDAGIPSAAKSKMHLYAVSGTPQGEMWAIGQGGQFVHFDGKAYEVGTSASVSDMRALWVRSADDIWAAGQSGVVQRWTRGTGWAKVASTPSATLNGLWGRSASDVWAVASTSGLYHFDGNAWSTVPGPATGTSQVLNALTGTPDGAMWAVGAAGTILHYTGSVWEREVTHLSTDLIDVALGAEGEVWAVGQREFVLRRSP